MKTAMKGLFFILLLVNMTAEASNTLQYNEAVDGDIYGNDFNLGIGVNTISGSGITAENSDSDFFKFYIPDGAQLTSFTFAFSNVVPYSSDTFFGTGYGIVDIAGVLATVVPYEFVSLFNDANVVLPTNFVYKLLYASPASLFINSLPLGPGHYFVETSPIYQANLNPGGSFDYTISMQVTAVPVPGAVWLFGSGLLGLLGFKKRKAV